MPATGEFRSLGAAHDGHERSEFGRMQRSVSRPRHRLEQGLSAALGSFCGGGRTGSSLVLAPGNHTAGRTRTQESVREPR
jgi:hypothetical protein